MITHSNHIGLPKGRRGAMLLMVLSMLSLFLLMGALGIVMATRSREAARAFAAATAGRSQLPAIARAAADDALLTLLRGSTDSTVRKDVTKSLLGDMYSTPIDQRYDAFDDDNPFLTRLTLTGSGQVTAAPRPAFRTGSNALLPCEVDNDGDGVSDGIWLDEVLPPVNLPAGGQLTFRVSYLVLDLDGRINVNAHGRRADDPRGSTEPEGPADVAAPTVVGGTTAWQLLLSTAGGSITSSGSVSPTLQWRPAPTINQSVDGRYASGTSTKTYSLRLDLEAPRPAMLASATTQNPFTLGELERVLRQFDADASTLPARLAGILGNNSERARMRITTDSWELPGSRSNIKWAAANAGVNDEIAFWNMLVPVIVSAGASQVEAQQWVANIVEFRDKDNSPNTPFPNGVNGVEPTSVGIPGPWNLGYFESPAQALGVPMGTAQEINDLRAAGLPVTSLAHKYPKILESITVPSLFEQTINADPKREPGRINVNTCDNTVWAALIGKDPTSLTAAEKNPYLPDDPLAPFTPAKNTLALLTNVPLVFSGTTYDVSTLNHSIANRFANAGTVRSHMFAIWITVEVTNTSATGATPTCYRLFAIVDRSIPVTYAEGQNNNVRDVIRLQRFLN